MLTGKWFPHRSALQSVTAGNDRPRDPETSDEKKPIRPKSSITQQLTAEPIAVMHAHFPKAH
ncbi:MAG: hypothetical protein PVI98_12650 [Burkholderiales bacterium]|jgi:hypothetical protein